MEEEVQSVLDSLTWPIGLGTLGSGVSTPRGSWYQVGGTINRNINSRGLTKSRIQIDVYAKTPAEAVYAAREVVSVFDEYRGGPIERVLLDTPPTDAAATDVDLLHRRRMTFLVTHRE